jgi:hypothetical protein
VDVAVALHLRPGEEVALHAAGEREGAGIEPGRRDRAEIQRLGTGHAGLHHLREADAAEAGIPRLDRGEGEGGGDRGIGGGAAGLEHGGAGLGRCLHLRDHHAAGAARGGLAQLPVLGDVRGEGVRHGLAPASGAVAGMLPPLAAGRKPGRQGLGSGTRGQGVQRVGMRRRSATSVSKSSRA